MDVIFIIGDDEQKNIPESYASFLENKIVVTLADQNPFWTLLEEYPSLQDIKVVAYWPENDSIFGFITERVKEIKRNYKTANFESLADDLKKYNKLYLPLTNWGEADIYIFYKIAKVLNLNEINVLLVRRCNIGGIVELIGLYYTAKAKGIKVKLYTCKEGKRWLERLENAIGKKYPFEVILID